MQSYDLMPAVSEITMDTDQAINWRSVKFVGQENHILSHMIHKAIYIHAVRPAINSD